MSVAAPQRFTKRSPCPVCGGGDDMKRGAGRRCSGFLSDDGAYAHCTREEHAGQLEPTSAEPRTFAHWLQGDCRCGVQHGPAALNGRASFDYVDEQGGPLFQVVRYEPKGFRQRRPDGKGGWIWNLADTRRVLYRLPAVLAAIKQGETIYVAEGEKDVHAIEAAGAVATCNPMGAGAGKWRPEFSQALAEATAVRVIADRDDEGRKHAETVAASLRDTGIADVAIVEAAEGKDAADHLAAGRTLEELVAVTSDQVVTAPESPRAPAATRGRGRSNVALSLIDLRTLKVKAVRWIEKPYLARGELHILQGHGSAGKGALTCLWAAEASQRGEHVVMVVAEDDLEAQIKPRLIAAGADFEYVHILAVHLEGVEDALEIPADLPMLEEMIATRNAQLVTIDPLLTHIASKTDSYKDHDIKRVLTPLAKIAQRTGCTIVGVHHFKKDTSGGARFAGQASTAFGTTARIILSMAKAVDGSHVMEVSKSNIGPENIGLAFQVSIVEIPADDGDTAEVPLLTRDGPATQTVDQILSAPKKDSKSGKARKLILDALTDVAHIESDELDARIANESGLAARTIRDLRMELRNEGLIRHVAVKDEFGKVTSWNVSRTNATDKAEQ